MSFSLALVTHAGSAQPCLEGLRALRDRLGVSLQVKLYLVHQLAQGQLDRARFEQDLAGADLVLLDILGGGPAASMSVAALIKGEQPVVLLSDSSPELRAVLRLRDRPEALEQARAYWSHLSSDNFCHLVASLGRLWFDWDLKALPPPLAQGDLGFYDLLEDRFLEECPAPGSLPRIALLLYAGVHFQQSAQVGRAIAQHLQGRAQTVGVYAQTARTLEALESLLPAFQPEALVSCRWFQLASFSQTDPQAVLRALENLNAPLFNAAPLYGQSKEEWLESIQGCTSVETMTAFILPELDGAVEPIPCAALQEVPSPLGEGSYTTVVALPEQVEIATARILKWIELRRRPAGEKRVAFVVYNTPAGEDNLGNAAYLDTFESLRRLLLEMKARGYAVENVPESGLHQPFVQQGLVNQARWSEPEKVAALAPGMGSSQFSSLERRSQTLHREWGPWPGPVMSHANEVVLPALEFGQCLIAVQSVRGFHDDPTRLSHDKSLPPHQQYVALYRYLEKVWRADVLVHVGTHGTLEFLQGKEMALSGNCWPLDLVGQVPHLYFYHIVNASEATIAKRRCMGTLINYNSPSFRAAGLYEHYQELEDLISEEVEARSLSPQRSQALQLRIQEKAREHALPEDLDELHEELGLLRRSVITQGLHILGQPCQPEEMLEFATLLCRADRPGQPAAHRLLAEQQGQDYGHLLQSPYQQDERGAYNALDRLEEQIRERIRPLLHADGPTGDPLQEALQQAAAASRQLHNRGEWENFWKGLQGGYIPPGLGGDPLRNPEVLPSGRNSFQFDPRLVPSDEACRRGAEIAENTLREYKRREGRYPDSAAVILWGFETTKTRGETVGQILHYLGMRLVGRNPYYKELQPIPHQELQRPRIDCLVQICGFFRDMYPNVMTMLNEAFRLASTLAEDEADNYVAKNTRARRQQLLDQCPADQLDKVASGRIYGPRAGEYGTRTTTLIESGQWQSEEELVALYQQNMNHLYQEGLHGVRQAAAYTSALGRVDLVSQVRDSHEYEIADLDHYYEYFGGLARTVESVRGSKPSMLISDTTRETIRTEDVKQALERGIRTRLLNPNWIDPLLEHEYHGAQEISDRVQYLIGFAATTGAVSDWVWDQVTERFLGDQTMFERMQQNNPYAAQEIAKRLLEAESRGYWEPGQEQKRILEERFLELEGTLEDGML